MKKEIDKGILDSPYPKQSGAAILRNVKDKDGYDIDTERRDCKIHGVVPHDKLLNSSPRVVTAEHNLTRSVRLRILKKNKYICGDTGLKYAERELHIADREPRVRRTVKRNYNIMTDDELDNYFYLLCHKSNYKMREDCKKCEATGKRAIRLGINYFYFGTQIYDVSLTIPCKGCYWYNSKKWRGMLNKKLNKV